MRKIALIFSLIIALASNVGVAFAYDEDYIEQTREYTKEEERIIEERVNERLASMTSLKASLKSSVPKVVIDAGHGGKDSGAVSRDGKVYEKNLNIDIANACANYLRSKGVDVVMTRTNDTWVELKERSTLSNKVNPNVYVSIHNDTAEGSGNGAHVIYSVKDKNGGPSKTLANNILNSIDANTIQNKSSRGIWTRTLDDGRDYYHVIREVKTTSVIVECSYMNPTDIQAVNTLEKRKAMGEAIAKGILQTLPPIKDYAGHWGESYIVDFLNKGYISGYAEGIFKPDNKITRAEFTKIVNRVFGFTNKTSINFSDVKSSEWFYNEVAIGVANGYIEGNPDNTFKPNAYITREEAAKMVGSILNLKLEGDTSFSDDTSISDWSKEYVKGLTNAGIINGFENKFNPQNNLTRAEAVKILYMSK